MECKVKINEFEGPLDLLLHLIKEAKIDIYEIELENITRQYLDYIRAMEELDLTIASEYLVMAAELIEMKSRLLLPNQDLDEEYEEEDPREALINRLVEYQRYKELTPKLKNLEEQRRYIYTKEPANVKEYKITKGITKNNDLTINDLLLAFERLLERNKESKPLDIKLTKKGITIVDRSNEIKKLLKQKNEVLFTELFDIMEKNYIIITFLAILEMVMNKEINIRQENNLDPIIICKKEVK